VREEPVIGVVAHAHGEDRVGSGVQVGVPIP
jgi:hypothetical protein